MHLCQEDRDCELSFAVVECSGLIHVGLKCMCVNISFLHESLTCQDRYPAARGRTRSPKGELSARLPTPFTSACLDRNQIHQLLRKGKSLGQFFSFFEMKDLVCLLLISRMMSASPIPTQKKQKKTPEIIRNGCTLNKYHQTSQTGAPVWPPAALLPGVL